MNVIALVVSCLMLLSLGVDAASSAVVDKPDTAELKELLQRKKFSELERRLSRYRTAFLADVRNEQAFGDALGVFYSSEPKMERGLGEWVRQHPSSGLAHVARALYFTAVGFERRGSKVIGKTSPAQIKGMHEAFDKALDDYEAALKLDEKSIYSYWGICTIAKARGLKRATEMALDLAITIEPNNSSVRLAYLDSLRPEWGGSTDQMAQFVTDTKRHYPDVPRLPEMESEVKGAGARQAERRRDFSGVIALSTEALAIYEKNYEALRSRGTKKVSGTNGTAHANNK